MKIKINGFSCFFLFVQIILVCALIAVAAAAPQKKEEPIAIISQSSNQEVDGSYQNR